MKRLIWGQSVPSKPKPSARAEVSPPAEIAKPAAPLIAPAVTAHFPAEEREIEPWWLAGRAELGNPGPNTSAQFKNFGDPSKEPTTSKQLRVLLPIFGLCIPLMLGCWYLYRWTLRSSAEPSSAPSSEPTKHPAFSRKHARKAQTVAPPSRVSSKSAKAEASIPAPAAAAQTPSASVAPPAGAGGGRLLYRVEPIYPPPGISMDGPSTIELRAIVNTTGEVTQIRLVKGPPTLAQAAMDAIRQWQYEPFTRDGKPVEREVDLMVYFQESTLRHSPAPVRIGDHFIDK